MILVKQNPNFFALSFTTQEPLVMQSYRRCELIVFIQSHMSKKPSVVVSAALSISTKGGKKFVHNFDDLIEKDKANFNSDHYLKDQFLQNFVNAKACGNL